MNITTMNDIYEDKTFLMFDKTDQERLKTDRSGRAYFIEKETGRVCFLYRFTCEVTGSQKLASRGHTTTIGGIAGVLGALAAAGVYTLLNAHALAAFNIFTLLGLIAFSVSIGVWISRRDYQTLLADYAITAQKENNLIFISEKERPEVFGRVETKKWKAFILLGVMLFAAIGTGYHFIMTSDVRFLLTAAIFSAFLTFIPNPKEWWTGIKTAEKMYFVKKS